MNGGQIAFYASVATVIPVVLSIYAVGLSQWPGAGFMALWELLKWVLDAFLSAVDSLGGKLTKRGRFGTLAVVIVRLAVIAYLVVEVLLCLVLGACVAFALVGPFLGEGFALHALTSNRATSDATMWATIGIATTGVALVLRLLPVLREILFWAFAPIRSGEVRHRWGLLFPRGDD
jgi:hypothetical protein